MPYIVTTKRPGRIDDLMKTRSRVAVATVEETRRMTEAFVAHVAAKRRDDYLDAGYGAFGNDCFNLSESGGTVGPLPDGTLIEVEPVETWSLWNALGKPEGMAPSSTPGRVIAAFNDANRVPS